MSWVQELAGGLAAELGVGRRAGLRLTAEAVGRGLHLLLIYAAQRTLGPVLYGHFTVALAFGLVLATVTSLGMPLVVTRELARHQADAARIAGAALALKLLLTVGAVGVLAVLAVRRPEGVRLATFVVGLAVLATSFVELIGNALRGLDRVNQETLLLLCLRVATLACGGWALWAGAGLLGFAAAYLLSAAVALLVGWGGLAWRVVSPRLRLDAVARSSLLGAAVPIGGATVLSALYARTGVFVLDAVHGPAAVGIYGVAQKLTEPLALVPAALMAAVFPVLSRPGGAEGRGRRLRQLSLWLLGAVGAVIAVAGVALGPALIRLLYPREYLDASVVLQLLAIAVVPTFLSYVLTHVLIAEDRQRLNLVFSAAVFILNAALCVLLAPAFGASGAAAAVIASEIVLLGLCLAAAGRSPNRRPYTPGRSA